MSSACPHCGAVLAPVHDAFCSVCREPLDESAEATPAAPATDSLSPPLPGSAPLEAATSQDPMAELLHTVEADRAENGAEFQESLKDRLVEFHRNLAELTPRAYMTPALISVNVIYFLVMAAFGVSLVEPTVADLVRWGANFAPKTLSGQWWRILSCTFIHVGMIHLLFNMWVLASAGPLVERMVGNIGYLVLYLVAGLCGSIASLFWNPQLVSAGASGAIFGIYGALLSLLLRHRGSIPPKALVHLRNSGLGFLFFNLLFGMTQQNIDSAAHIGGLLGGFLGGIVLSQPFTPEALAGRPIRNVLLGGLGILLVIGGGIGVSLRNAEMVKLQHLLDGPKVSRGHFDVFYMDGTTEAAAIRLGDYLAGAAKESPNRATVYLKKAGDVYQFGIVIKQEFQENEKILAHLELDGAKISRDVVDGAAVEVCVCDKYMKTLKVLPPRADVRYGIVDGPVEVFFAKEIQRSDAQRLAKYLVKELGEGTAKCSFKLAEHGGVVELHMVVQPTALKDPAMMKNFREIREEIAVNVFNKGIVELHLCDDVLKAVQVLKP